MNARFISPVPDGRATGAPRTRWGRLLAALPWLIAPVRVDRRLFSRPHGSSSAGSPEADMNDGHP